MRRLQARQTYEAFEALGIPREETFFGTLDAGHPGGSFPLTQAEAQTLHHDVLPANLYLADSSLFPRSMGKPLILTIMALAKRVARLAAQEIAWEALLVTSCQLEAAYQQVVVPGVLACNGRSRKTAGRRPSQFCRCTHRWPVARKMR